MYYWENIYFFERYIILLCMSVYILRMVSRFVFYTFIKKEIKWPMIYLKFKLSFINVFGCFFFFLGIFINFLYDDLIIFCLKRKKKKEIIFI